MIELKPIYYNTENLNNIARFRNMQPEILRNGYTLPEENYQKDWIKKFIQRGEKYWFIMLYNESYDSNGNKIDEKSKFDCIGYCGLSKIDPWNRSSEISILFDPDKETQDNYNNVLFLLKLIAFKNLDLHCLYVEIYLIFDKRYNFIINTRLFTKEGILRHRKFWGNKWYNSWIGSIINPDHEAKNE